MFIPSMLYTASMNTTVAVAIPFGEFSVRKILSLNVCSFLVLITIPMNLISKYAPYNVRLCMKNVLFSGKWMTSPRSTNTNMNIAFARTVSALSRLVLCFWSVFPKNSPSAVTASTPLPPRFSASTYDSSAAMMTAMLE